MSSIVIFKEQIRLYLRISRRRAKTGKSPHFVETVSVCFIISR